MRDTMDVKEALEMMNRCKHEIMDLRAQIDRLTPKADAYDKLAIVLGLLPRQSVGMARALVEVLSADAADDGRRFSHE